MDSMVSTAARALAFGDPVGALSCIALRSDPPALALRGIAMAQLGELPQARRLLRRAGRAFGAKDALARARCTIAEAEIALASRDLTGTASDLDDATVVLTVHGDRSNALFAQLVKVRRFVLLGEVAQAHRVLSGLELERAPARLLAFAELALADIALRQLHTKQAREALGRAQQAALHAQIPALTSEVQHALHALHGPAARLRDGDQERLLRLDEVEALLGSGKLVVNACRREIRMEERSVSLLTRPVLFALARALAQGPEGEVNRRGLLYEVFGAKAPNDSHRARLRVEIGRLRKAMRGLGTIRATADGYALLPLHKGPVLLLSPLSADDASALLALLSAGEAWSTSSLAAALGKSQRSVQRALVALEETKQAHAVGRGRAQRWVVPPSTGFATSLLLIARNSLG